jgi:hypothetical protein
MRRFFSTHSPTPDEARTLALWEEILEGLSQLKVSQQNWALEEDPKDLRRKIDWITKLWLLNRYDNKSVSMANDRWLRTLDLKYHDLDPATGLYLKCEATGLVDRMVDEKTVWQARSRPPDNTRARIRGLVIHQTAGMNLEVKIEDWEKINIRPKGRNGTSAHPFNQHKGSVHHLGIRLDDPFKATDSSIFEQIEHFVGIWG